MVLTQNYNHLAQKAILNSRTEARNMNYNYIGPEHLLIGCSSLNSGIFRDFQNLMPLPVIHRLGLYLDTVKDNVTTIFSPPIKLVSLRDLPKNNYYDQAIFKAELYAHKRNESKIGALALFHGLITIRGYGKFSKLLRMLNLDVSQILIEIDKENYQ